MKVSIDKVLEKKQEQEKKRLTQDPINEVKLLLQGDETEDLRILRGLSQNSQLTRVENIQGSKLELEKLETNYEGKVYNIKDIKQLAIDYKLRFLPSLHYTGSFDTQVASKIKEFAKKTNSPIDEWSLGKRYYILAPEEMFELKDEKYITKKQLGPVIFFQIDDTHYRLIHKWGNDFTVFRYLLGFKYKSWWNFQLFNTVTVLPVVAFIFSLIFPVHDISNYPIFLTFLCVFTSFIFSYFRWGWGRHDEGNEIRAFFTPHNWNDIARIKR